MSAVTLHKNDGSAPLCGARFLWRLVLESGKGTLWD